MRLSNWQQQLGVVCHSLLCAGCNNRLEPQQTPGSGKGKPSLCEIVSEGGRGKPSLNV
jgi:hypothetical protein